MDPTLGPSLIFLRERTGADFALEGVGRKISVGAARLALEASLRGGASPLRFQFDAPIPTGSYAGPRFASATATCRPPDPAPPGCAVYSSLDEY
jgi:hypothetical protein